jgi:hypothetical protein
MAKQTDYANLLSALDDHQRADTVSISCPSVKSKSTFKKINVPQQKGILKAAMDPSLPELLFIIQANEILQNNQVTDTTLHVVDRVSALLQLRCATLGNKLASDATSAGEQIDITDHLKKVQKIKIPSQLQSGTFSHDEFKADCYIPTLEEDTAINKACLRIIQDKVKTEDGLKDSVGDIYVYEVVKYIKNISYTSEEQEQIIPFDTLSVKQKISIFEKLPMGLTVDISKYITSLRKFEDQILNIPGPSGDEDDTIIIDFNASLFSLE